MTTLTHNASAVPAPSQQVVDPIFRQIRDLVYKVSGIYQLEEKMYLLADGCGRRMKEINVKTPRDYWDYLAAHPSRDGEIRQLLNELTIGETCLFRSQPQIDAIRKVILPELMHDKTKQSTKRIRIWSAGCSTGEEPYTLAITALEEMESRLKGWQVEIVATDLNDRSVASAQEGIYGDYALRNTSELIRRKYFTAAENRKLQVKPEVKKLITFKRLNLSDDTQMLFMKGMDIIFCCNVLIYFDVPSKTKVINHFFSNLVFGGYFFLGISESLLKLNTQFHVVHFPGAIAYWKPSLSSGKL